jgi:ATP-binding cassette subfamily C protein
MFAAFRTMRGFLTVSERRRYVALIVARVLTGLLDVAGIALIGLIASVAAQNVDSASDDAGPVTIAGFEIPDFDSAALLWLVLVVLVLFSLKAVFATALIRVQAIFVAGVETRNVRSIAAFLLQGSLARVKQYSKADIQFAMTGSTTYAFTGLMNNYASIVTESFLLLVITATFFLVNAAAAVFALLYFAMIVAVIQLVIGRTLKRAAKEAVAGTVTTIGLLSDTVDTFREIAVLNKQELFSDRISDSRAKISRSNATMTYLGGMPRYVVEAALILGVVILVAQQFMSNQLSSGLVTVGVFLAGGARMMASLLPLQNAIANMKQNAEQASMALGLLGEARDSHVVRPDRGVLPEESGHPGSAPGGLSIDVARVKYRYPETVRDTIRGATLTVAPGSFAALVGPSGAGKTTIVDLILGLLEPDSGTITIGGIAPSTLRILAPGQIAYVPQRPGLMSGTIAENIALGVAPGEVDVVALDRAIDAAHLREFVASLPAGVNTSVGKQVNALSGGQIQRIGVARALYSSPRLLILDEATSGLDASAEAVISTTLRAIAGDVTVVVVAHRLSTVQHADVVHVVEDGRITASGDFRSVVSRVPMVAEYVKLLSFDQDEAGAAGATSARPARVRR